MGTVGNNEANNSRKIRFACFAEASFGRALGRQLWFQRFLLNLRKRAFGDWNFGVSQYVREMRLRIAGVYRKIGASCFQDLQSPTTIAKERFIQSPTTVSR